MSQLGREQNRAAPRCSVVVPVYRHWARIPALLYCLEAQSLPRDAFEIILVNNEPEADLPALPEGVRLVECSVPGSYVARNRGAAVSRGEVLAFTDADCRPEPEWLAAGLAAAGTPPVQLVAGAIRVEKVSAQPSRWEIYDAAMALPQRRYAREGFGATANLFVPREIFRALGGFSEHRYSGGDRDLCLRARAAGRALVYQDQAVVRHPARTTREAVIGKLRRIKGGQIGEQALLGRIKGFLRTFLPPVHAWRRALRRRDLPWRERWVVVAVQARLWPAEMAEALRLVFRGKGAERE
ncbi:glycosyltransferase [Gammaproteobacteria bacterium AB-CW1]|uniref:Glycosyltransferase n=1 Tax=Natronospira elongata TaxID=3110268 RepID=A0AAP6JHP6_9GAMM|nr:glycosyltransferase [Gammaproteobacteria bacterium AB-CW1]